MIDINASYGHWPFLQNSCKSLEELEDHLLSSGIEQALVSHLGAVWNPDVEAYNRELINDAAEKKGIIPIPIVNPSWHAPFDWYNKEIDLVGFRILPSFHGYSIQDQVMDPLARYLTDRERVLFIQMRIEDERMQHPAARVDSVPLEDILRLHARFPSLKLICLNAYLPEVHLISEHTQNIGFDTSFCEWLYTMESMLDVLPAARIYLGTHTPILYTKAGILKVSKSRIAPSIKDQVMARNAGLLLGG